MPRTVFIVLLSALFIGGCGPAALAQEAPESDIESVQAAEDEMRQAILRQDIDALERLWTERFMVNAPRNVVVPNREAVLQVFRSGVAAYESYEQAIETIEVSEGVAVVMGRETVVPVGEAPHAGGTVHRRYTHVWRERDGAWRLAARHAHITEISD
ncbi:MAG: nuclear transport factor 2 family protein [Longimonas sp.]|uniref:nuclear transport factor 2 family protein n=1 Tax=Longimonas sp. TaxID=2039626 RepID=UPI00334B27F0